ncbi:MAG: flagellin, partial [Ruminococcus sp.]|nr:flagellin [Ruminococcus sp.]
MMGMVVQHNISAQNANEAMRKNVAGLKKQTEKLSTGYSINRAADNAAGLAISEKMRSQIRGLSQATANSNDAISLIQTAEGGLQETEDIMQRMRELAVQSANGTYTDEDREQIQHEVDALKEEVDRIASSTEYNEMKLLDGSLDGGEGNTGVYGARYGTAVTAASGAWSKGDVITSDIAGVKVSITNGASGKGGENAAWDATGKTLTINLVEGQSYSQSQIDDLIKNANEQKTAQSGSTAEVKVTLANGRTGTVGSAAATSAATAAGVRGASADTSLASVLVAGATTEQYADTIKFTSNSYGADSRQLAINFDVAAGKEEVTTTTADTDDYTKDGSFTLHLATGTEYTEDDIERIMAKAGLDYSVTLTDTATPDGDTKLYANTKANIAAFAIGTGGAGVG